MSDVLYVRLPENIKRDIDEYAKRHALTINRAAIQILEVGLHGLSKTEPTIRYDLLAKALLEEMVEKYG